MYYILYPEQKTFISQYALFPLYDKQLLPWEVCSLDNPWYFAASHALIRCMNRCTWKSSKYYTTIIMMASLIRVPY